MRRETQNILLILLGGALLKIGINGEYLRYVKPAHQPWVIAGGAVILILGLIAIVGDVLKMRRSSATEPASDEAEGHHHQARSAWFLLVPVLAVFLVAPPALGADSVTRTQDRAADATSVRNGTVFPPLAAGDVVPLSVSEFVTRAGWDSTGSLHGRTVSLTGFVVRKENTMWLARMVIGCCAADAYPVTVRLTGLPADFANDTWLEVTGQVVPGSAREENDYAPDLVVTTATPKTAPEDPYES